MSQKEAELVVMREIALQQSLEINDMEARVVTMRDRRKAAEFVGDAETARQSYSKQIGLQDEILVIRDGLDRLWADIDLAEKSLGVAS